MSPNQTETPKNPEATYPQFRKTKTGNWAVMGPVDDLEKALAAGGKVDVRKKSGDWSNFTVGSLGKPFDVDGVQMCYGYAPEAETDDQSEAAKSAKRTAKSASRGPKKSYEPPPADPTEPLPHYQGDDTDGWHSEQNEF